MSTAFDDVNPWPSKAVPEAVGSIPGHNRPLPSDDALAEFKDQLHQRKSNFAERAESLVGSADRAVAIDEETFGRCGELKKQITAMLKLVDDAHVSAKAPYLEAGRAVDGAKKATRAPLEAAQAMVQCKLDAFAREERQRREAEQRRAEDARRAQAAEQRAREEAARAANQPAPEPEQPVAPAAPIAEPTRVRGDYGALVSEKTVWRHEVTDWEVAFMAVAENEKVREAIDKVIGAMVRSGTRKIEGVRIYSDTVAQVR